MEPISVNIQYQSSIILLPNANKINSSTLQYNCISVVDAAHGMGVLEFSI